MLTPQLRLTREPYSHVRKLPSLDPVRHDCRESFKHLTSPVNNDILLSLTYGRQVSDGERRGNRGNRVDLKSQLLLPPNGPNVNISCHDSQRHAPQP